jgi:hypothetical protein
VTREKREGEKRRENLEGRGEGRPTCALSVLQSQWCATECYAQGPQPYKF